MSKWEEPATEPDIVDEDKARRQKRLEKEEKRKLKKNRERGHNFRKWDDEDDGDD